MIYHEMNSDYNKKVYLDIPISIGLENGCHNKWKIKVLKKENLLKRLNSISILSSNIISLIPYLPKWIEFYFSDFHI